MSVVGAQTSLGVHVAAVCVAYPIQGPPCDVTIVVADNDCIQAACGRVGSKNHLCSALWPAKTLNLGAILSYVLDISEDTKRFNKIFVQLFWICALLKIHVIDLIFKLVSFVAPPRFLGQGGLSKIQLDHRRVPVDVQGRFWPPAGFSWCHQATSWNRVCFSVASSLGQDSHIECVWVGNEDKRQFCDVGGRRS